MQYSGPDAYGTAGATTYTEMYNYNQAGGMIGKRLRIQRTYGYWYDNGAFYTQTTSYVDLDGVFTYDNEGKITGIQYPLSGPNVTWAFDSMGRLNGMSDGGGAGDLISGATYGPSSEMLSLTGKVSESRTYNSMLQLTQLSASAYDNSQSVSFAYAYSANQNNGKITSQTDNVSGEQVVYTYDALNRLATAEATSAAWGQSYSYDGFGNLTAQNVIAGSPPQYSATANPATNQISSSDANGNTLLAANPPYNLSYDMSNRLTGGGTALQQQGNYEYAYAPGNKRVWRGVCCGADGENNPIMSTDEVAYWSVTGQKLATYQISGEGVVQEAYTPAPALTATETATWYYFGSKMIKNAGGYVVADRLGSIGHFYPYGLEKPSATTNGTEKFTGYLRDAETAMDYAINRYHVPGTGRFLTPDPSMDGVDFNNPQSWNAYAYVNGDPINFNDASGLGPVTLPPVVPGVNCSTAFINYAAQFGETIQQLFDSDAGILRVMNYFEQQGSGSNADQQVWAALDWVFLDRWNLSASDKAWFYGPRNIPTSFAAAVTTGNTRSQVFTSSGQLTAANTTTLLNILTGSPDSSQCEGLAAAFDVAQGTINANNGAHIPGLDYITNPFPGALAFGSDGAVPSHSPFVRQTPVGTVQDGIHTWTFFTDTYTPPPVRRPPRRPRPR